MKCKPLFFLIIFILRSFAPCWSMIKAEVDEKAQPTVTPQRISQGIIAPVLPERLKAEADDKGQHPSKPQQQIPAKTFLTRLPEDIRIEILSYLSKPRDFASLLQACKDHHQKLRQNFSTLTLTNKNLRGGVIPEAVFSLNLRSLNLYRCRLNVVPEKITLLSNLEELNLSCNPFYNEKSLSFVAVLTKLTILKLAHCMSAGGKLDSLPEEISLLTDLTALDISSNNFRSNELQNLILSLTRLKILNVAACKLLSSPDKITQLINLKTLALGSNHFLDGRLPSVILSLTNVTNLDVSNCSLKSLPDEMRLQTNLRKLCIGQNQFVRRLFPLVIISLTNLNELDLSFSEFKSLPAELMQLPNLQQLIVPNNHLGEIPKSHFIPIDNIGANTVLKKISNAPLTSNMQGSCSLL